MVVQLAIRQSEIVGVVAPTLCMTFKSFQAQNDGDRVPFMR